jgi:hypothetical protein
MSICGTIDPLLSTKQTTTRTNFASAVGMKRAEDLWPNGSTVKIYFDMTPEEASNFTWGQDHWLVATAKGIYKGDYIWKGQKDPIQIATYGSSLSFPQILSKHNNLPKKRARGFYTKIKDEPMETDMAFP